MAEAVVCAPCQAPMKYVYSLVDTQVWECTRCRGKAHLKSVAGAPQQTGVQIAQGLDQRDFRPQGATGRVEVSRVDLKAPDVAKARDEFQENRHDGEG